MFERGLSLIFALGFVLATALPAAAQQVPDLVGTWKGPASAIYTTSNPNPIAQGSDAQFLPNPFEFTYVVKEQHGNRFAGETGVGTSKETIIGALRPDNRGGIILDNDGRYDFTLMDANTMDMCYAHQFPTSRVAGCWRLTRSR